MHGLLGATAWVDSRCVQRGGKFVAVMQIEVVFGWFRYAEKKFLSIVVERYYVVVDRHAASASVGGWSHIEFDAMAHGLKRDV